MLKANVDLAKNKEPKIIVEGNPNTILNEALGVLSTCMCLTIRKQFKTKQEALKFSDDLLDGFKKYMSDQICFDKNLS